MSEREGRSGYVGTSRFFDASRAGVSFANERRCLRLNTAGLRKASRNLLGHAGVAAAAFFCVRRRA